MSDYIVRATAADSQIRAFAITSKEMVEEARRAHDTRPVITAALGRLLSGAAMMGTMMKGDNDLLTIQIQCGGPAKGLTVTADSHGHVKGFPMESQVELPLNAQGKLDVGRALGLGVMSVIKDMGLKEPYVGQIALQTGEIAEDLTSYYAYSEQVPTVMALGVLVDKDLSILCAGGFMVQLLPGATDAEITQLEQNIAAMPSVTELLREGKTPEDMMNLALAGFNPNVLDEREVQYECDCSAERTEEMLLSLGRKELEKLRDEDPDCEVVCHFCHTKYHFDLNQLVEKAAYKKEAAEEPAENA